MCTAPGKSWCEKNGVSGLEMNRFDATKPTIDARDESIADSMTRFRHAVGATSTRRPRCASNAARSGVALRHAPKRDDGQVLPAAAMLDDQLHDGTGSPSHERVWLRTWRPGVEQLARPAVVEQVFLRGE